MGGRERRLRASAPSVPRLADGGLGWVRTVILVPMWPCAPAANLCSLSVFRSQVAQAGITFDISQAWPWTPGHAVPHAQLWPMILIHYSNNKQYLKSTGAAQFKMEFNKLLVNGNNHELKMRFMRLVPDTLQLTGHMCPEQLWMWPDTKS